MNHVFKLSAALIVSSAISGLLITAPSYGISLNNFVNSIKSQIQEEMSQVKAIAQNKIDQLWAATQEDASLAIAGATGVMGAPDPISSGEQLKLEIADKYSWPVAQQQAQDLERQLAKASVSAVMGQQGQLDTANKINETTTTASNAADLAQQAQGMNASQNILKVIAAQNGQIVSMLAQQRTDSLQSRQDTAQSNLMLTQIADQLASQRQREDIRQEGIISLNHELAAMSVLDVAYVAK